MSIDRLNAFQIINKNEAALLFEPFNDKLNVLDLSPIHIGMSNSNYVVTTTETKYLLKLYANPTDIVEMGAYSYLKDKINVPEPLYYDGSKQKCPYAYAVLEYIDGITLKSYIQANESLAVDIVYEIGKLCAAIHRKKYDYDALLNQDLTVNEQIPKTRERILYLLNDKAGKHLKRDTVGRLFAFIESHASLFDKMEAESVLCHGDFSFNNILIMNRKVYFIDFEFAYAGSRYHDIGHFFRRKSDEIQAYINNCVYNAFADGYNSIAPLPLYNDWLTLASLCDIAPMLCLINRDKIPEEWVEDIEHDILSAICM